MTVHATVCSTTVLQTVVTWEALDMTANTNRRLVAPTTEKQTVALDMTRRRSPASDLGHRAAFPGREDDFPLAR
jgi:hypothetical protein